MNKLLFAMLMGLVVSLFNVTATVQAQEINNSSLNGKERGIVAVAAFTANGDMEKLKAALNEGLDTGMTVNFFY